MDGVPEPVRAKAIAAGATRWLADLPALVAELQRQWSLALKPAYLAATEAYVDQARLSDGTRAVLQVMVARRVHDAATGITVLGLGDGTGCARLLRHDVARGALLTERLGPSLHDLGLPLPQRHEILCDVASQLLRPAPGCGLPTGAEKGEWLIA